MKRRRNPVDFTPAKKGELFIMEATKSYTSLSHGYVTHKEYELREVKAATRDGKIKAHKEVSNSLAVDKTTPRQVWLIPDALINKADLKSSYQARRFPMAFDTLEAARQFVKHFRK